MLIKKLNKTDYLFALFLFIGVIFHIFGIFSPSFTADESFYTTIPLRLMNGDSLIQHEWHLSQFSSLLLYIPIYLWTRITGSLNGIFIFLRILYLLIHTVTANLIYVFFRKHRSVAIAAAMMFYLHIPYKLYAISYMSSLVICLLLFSLCLLSMYRKKSKKVYFTAGCLYSICCICNPAFCLLIFVYILAYILWLKKESVANFIKNIQEKKRKKTNKHKASKKDISVNYEELAFFFYKKSIPLFFSGIVFVAIITMFFFFKTGGNFSSITVNLQNIINSSEHISTSSPLAEKISAISQAINKISFNMPFLLPLLFLALLLDKNRKNHTNRFIYLLSSLLLGVLYTFGILDTLHFKTACFSLPFTIFSLVCYIVTENKNKTLFYFMWCPSIIAAIIGIFTSNTVLFIVGAIFSISNTAGVFFVYDLYKEILNSAEKKRKKVRYNQIDKYVKKLICIAFVVQLTIYGIALQYELIINTGSLTVVESGPYKGVLINAEEHIIYNNYLKDFETIKELSNPNDPVLFSTFNNWAYPYVERPEATYTAWFTGEFNKNSLLDYYKENPEKTPRYIYIDSYNLQKEYSPVFMEHNINIANELFNYTQEQLLNGVLLTVTECKF